MITDKHQLISGMLHDLADENEGSQVRGYRNTKIISSVTEALVQLRELVKKDDQDLKAKDDEIAILKEQLEKAGILVINAEPGETKKASPAGSGKNP